MQYHACHMSKSCLVANIVCFFVLALLSLSATAQPANSPEQIPACRRFVQDFYSWYVPFTQKPTNGPAFNLALRNKAEVFSPELLRALKLDSEAQARAKGEIDGIDFDPLVGGLDPADHYTVRQVTVKGDRCFAEVWRDSPTDTTEKSRKPDAVAELAQRAGHWEFVNFHYPEVSRRLAEYLDRLHKQRGQR